MLLTLTAQNVSGIVVDSKGVPLEFVSVALLHATDSGFVSGCVTDEQGRFSFHTEEQHSQSFLIKATSVSYKPCFLKCEDGTADLRLVMEDDMVEYASVIVNGKRPFTKNVGDKVVFNPQLMKNIDAMQADDMLKYVPGVMVSKSGITYNGKGGVILVNDREVSMDYIANLNASDIERVELRKSHAGMYSATIQGGIINIVTKKGLLGFRGNASMYADTQFRNTYSLIPRASIFFGTEKWNVYANYSFGQSRSKQSNEAVNEFLYNNITHKSESDVVSFEKSHYYAVGTVFNLSENHQISFEVNGSHTPKGNSKSTADETLTLADGSIHAAEMRSDNPYKSDLYNVAASYKWDIDTLGSSLKLLMNYNKKKSEDDNYLVVTYPSMPSNNINEIDAAKADAENVSGRADFEKDWKSGWKLTLGGEYSTSKRYSEMVFNMLLDNTTNSSSWNYREQTAGGYLGVEKQFGHFYAIARMRIDYAYLRGFTSDNDDVKHSSTDFVPYAYLRYSTDDGWNFDASYTKKIERPAFSDRIGYLVRYSDVLYDMGNPDLKHNVTDYIGLSVNHKGHTFLAEYESTSDVMVTTLRTENGITYIQKRNEGTRKMLFLTYNYGGNLFPWWQTNFLTRVTYIHYPESYNQSSIWWGLFNWVNRFSWERVGTFELSAAYYTKYLEANITQEWNGAVVDFSYERNLGKHFTTSVGVSDIFNGKRTHAINMSPTLIYDFRNNSVLQTFWCKLTYNFANKRKTKTEQLDNNNEIINRM
jgi:hypothetical protein